MAAVKCAQAHETAQNVCQIAAEHAPVAVNFVHHDVFQVFKQLHPFGVLGQDAAVQHVRVSHHHMPSLSHGPAGGGGRVAVVGEGLDVRAQKLDQLVQLGHLIGGQGFGGEEVQRPGVGVFEDFRQHGQVIAQGFPGGRGRDHHVILPRLGRGEAFRLMGVQLMHPMLSQGGGQTGIDALRPGGVLRLPGRHHAPRRHVFHKERVVFQLFQHLRQVHSGPL